MNSQKPLVFFGTEDFSLPSLETLIEAGWPIAIVVTKPDAPKGRGLQIAQPAVKKLAEAHDIKVLQPEQVEILNEELRHLQPTHGVLVAYGKIVPKSTIDIFPGGIINVHPSLLPKYRGPSPIETAILNGDQKTGISLMKLTPKMDAGPVYKQLAWPLSGTEDRLELYNKLSEAGAKLLVENLPHIVDGRLEPLEQDHSEASYSCLLKKADGLIDWQSEPALQIERKVRAYLGFPKTRAMIWDKYEVVITKARVAEDENNGRLVVACSDGFVEILELIAPSGRRMSGADFKLGHKA